MYTHGMNMRYAVTDGQWIHGTSNSIEEAMSLSDRLWDEQSLGTVIKDGESGKEIDPRSIEVWYHGRFYSEHATLEDAKIAVENLATAFACVKIKSDQFLYPCYSCKGWFSYEHPSIDLPLCKDCGYSNN